LVKFVALGARGLAWSTGAVLTEAIIPASPPHPTGRFAATDRVRAVSTADGDVVEARHTVSDEILSLWQPREVSRSGSAAPDAHLPTTCATRATQAVTSIAEPTRSPVINHGDTLPSLPPARLFDPGDDWQRLEEVAAAWLNQRARTLGNHSITSSFLIPPDAVNHVTGYETTL
jgi:hypothetical protein